MRGAGREEEEREGNTDIELVVLQEGDESDLHEILCEVLSLAHPRPIAKREIYLCHENKQR